MCRPAAECYTFLGNIFCQREIAQKMPLNPYSDRVHNHICKITKKRKSYHLVTFEMELYPNSQ